MSASRRTSGRRGGSAQLAPLFAATLLGAAAPTVALGADEVNGRAVVGIAERVRLDPDGFELRAKIDTGADLSSINAENLEIVVRNGRRRAVFDVVNSAGQRLHLDRQIVRRTRIKQTGNGQPEIRPVVRLGICLDGVYRRALVSLADRTGFDYQLLLGVDFLAGHFVVDPSLSMTREPRCPPHPTQ